MVRAVIVFVASLISLQVSAEKELVTLRNLNGDEINCRINEVSEKMVTLTREDGQQFEFPIEKLDEKSRKLVEEVRIDLLRPIMKVTLGRGGEIAVLDDFVDVPLDQLNVDNEEVYQISITTDKPGDSRYFLKYYIFDGDIMRKGRKSVILAPGKSFSLTLKSSNREQEIGAERYIHLKNQKIKGHRRPLGKECVIYLMDFDNNVIQAHVSSFRCAKLLEDNANELM